ncbi:DDE Tnp4 domain-containing protein [Pycnococcus provasolii]
MLHALVNDVQDYCYEDMYEDLDDEEDTALFLYLALMLADDNDDTALRITEEVRDWGGSRPGRRYSVPKWLSSWVCIETQLSRISEASWIAQFGMKKELFRKIVQDLRPAIESRTPRSSAFRQPLTTELQVAVALVRFRFGHSFRTCATWFGLGVSTARKCVLDVMAAICSTYTDVIKLPTGNDIDADLQLMAEKGLPACAWALDGTEIPVRARSRDTVAKRNRKGVVSDKALLLCNHNLIIRFSQVGIPGSAADGRAFSMSSLQPIIDQGVWPPGGHDTEVCGVVIPPQILVDAAFATTRATLRPFSGDTQSSAEREFNFMHSSMRMCVERLNGVLKRRFQTLAKPAEWWDESNRFMEVHCCFVLHNLIRSSGDTNFEDDEEDEQDAPQPPSHEQGVQNVNALAHRAALCAHIAANDIARKRYRETAQWRRANAVTVL